MNKLALSEIRLNKFIAQSGLCSRRAADELIASGKIFVNGELETSPGRKITSADEVKIEEQILKPLEKKEYIILNKPVQVLCTRKDPGGRQTIFDLLPEKFRKEGLFSIGRLDYFSEGLLIITNDGELANKLMHPRFQHEKVYKVRVRGDIDEEAIGRMRSGMLLKDGTRLLPVAVNVSRRDKNTCTLVMRLHQGINRQIRRMCENLGLVILSLERIEEAGIKLGKLPKGKWRNLDSKEIEFLKKA